MQFSTLLSVACSLAASSMAHPAVKQSNGTAKAVSGLVEANVLATISQWQAAIDAVNNFVDTAGGITDANEISFLAATAFNAAQVEGTSNTFLQKAVTLDASGQAAARALLGQFGIIGPAINDTISNPGNLQKNLNAINGARCPAPRGANAISQEGAVQAAAASAVGASVPPPATPAACNNAAKATNGAQKAGGRV